MKWTMFVKEKRKAILGLFIILAALTMANFIHRKNYHDLDQHISSIYEDRLLPATFLFDMIDNLYQKKMLVSANEPVGDSVKNLLQQYNAGMKDLVNKYEATFLTAAEKEHWHALTQNMSAYNMGEAVLMAGNGKADAKKMETHFDQAIYALNQLATIQVTEGHLLQKNSRSIIRFSLINMQLEIALLVILGIAALMMAGNSKLPFLQYKERKELLN